MQLLSVFPAFILRHTCSHKHTHSHTHSHTTIHTTIHSHIHPTHIYTVPYTHPYIPAHTHSHEHTYLYSHTSVPSLHPHTHTRARALSLLNFQKWGRPFSSAPNLPMTFVIYELIEQAVPVKDLLQPSRYFIIGWHTPEPHFSPLQNEIGSASRGR